MELRPELEDVAERFVRACDRARVPYVLIGGLAAGAHGSGVRTDDVDACVDLRPDEAERIEALLTEIKAEGFRINVEALNRRVARGHAILFLWIGLVRLDVMLRKADGYWDAALRHRCRATYNGREFWFASIEELAALKLAAGRIDDFRAVDKIMARHFRKLDLDRLRENARRLAFKVPELPARVEAAIDRAREVAGLASLPPDDEA